MIGERKEDLMESEVTNDIGVLCVKHLGNKFYKMRLLRLIFELCGDSQIFWERFATVQAVWGCRGVKVTIGIS